MIYEYNKAALSLICTYAKTHTCTIVRMSNKHMMICHITSKRLLYDWTWGHTISLLYYQEFLHFPFETQDMYFKELKIVSDTNYLELFCGVDLNVLHYDNRPRSMIVNFYYLQYLLQWVWIITNGHLQFYYFLDTYYFKWYTLILQHTLYDFYFVICMYFIFNLYSYLYIFRIWWCIPFIHPFIASSIELSSRFDALQNAIYLNHAHNFNFIFTLLSYKNYTSSFSDMEVKFSEEFNYILN